jgi:glycosyltransferase involved in cell wall biosynthesis
MPIRLLFLNTRDRCGADVAVHLTLMRHLPPEQVSVFVISNSEAADAEEMREVFAGMPHVTSRFLPLGKPADAVARRNLPARALSYAPSLASLARAAAFVRRHDIQIIHATDRPRDASYASLLGRLTRARTVVHMHAPVTHLSRPTLWGMRNASALFAVSESVRSDLVRLGLDPQRVFTLHNAVDTDFFHPQWKPATPASIRSRFGMPAHARVAGIVARLNPWKGQYELIGALSLLRHAIPDLHVLIVGADVPEVRRDFEQRARKGGVADRVHFAGFHGDVRPILQELDLFVHPSYGEPFGLSIVEAMAM